MLFLSCFLFCFRARLFIDAMWLPAGKGPTSWLSFVMFNCEVVTFPLVSWLDCLCPLSYFVGSIFHFYSNFNRIFCKPIVETLIRRRVLRRLIWVYTVCIIYMD